MRLKRLSATAAVAASLVILVSGCKEGAISLNADGSGSSSVPGEVVPMNTEAAQSALLADPARIATAKERIAAIRVAESSDGGVKYKRDSMYPTWEPAWADWGWNPDLPKKKDGTPACDVREAALIRDTGATFDPKSCKVASALNYQDPYTGQIFTSKSDLDIDHIVALSDAHKSGAYNLSEDYRISLANDPENVIPVFDKENQKGKGDKNAAEYLPPNAGVRCFYVAAQTNIKYRYELSMTPTEKAVIEQILAGC